MKTVKIETFNSKCNASSTAVNVGIHLDEDVSAVHPFLNAVMEKPRFLPKVPFVRFLWEGHVVNVESRRVNAFGFENEAEALAAAESILTEIERVMGRMDALVPDHTEYKPPPLLEIYKHLPRIQGCSRCGHPSCMAFASAVSRGDCCIEDCLPLEEEEHAEKLAKLIELVG